MALILRNGGSQSPDRWLRDPRNNQTMGECRDVTDQYSETTFQKIVDFERSFLLCLIAGTGNLHG